VYGGAQVICQNIGFSHLDPVSRAQRMRPGSGDGPHGMASVEGLRHSVQSRAAACAKDGECFRHSSLRIA